MNSGGVSGGGNMPVGRTGAGGGTPGPGSRAARPGGSTGAGGARTNASGNPAANSEVDAGLDGMATGPRQEAERLRTTLPSHTPGDATWVSTRRSTSSATKAVESPKTPAVSAGQPEVLGTLVTAEEYTAFREQIYNSPTVPLTVKQPEQLKKQTRREIITGELPLAEKLSELLPGRTKKFDAQLEAEKNRVIAGNDAKIRRAFANLNEFAIAFAENLGPSDVVDKMNQVGKAKYGEKAMKRYADAIFGDGYQPPGYGPPDRALDRVPKEKQEDWWLSFKERAMQEGRPLMENSVLKYPKVLDRVRDDLNPKPVNQGPGAGPSAQRSSAASVAAQRPMITAARYLERHVTDEERDTMSTACRLYLGHGFENLEWGLTKVENEVKRKLSQYPGDVDKTLRYIFHALKTGDHSEARRELEAAARGYYQK
jgi:hypothetical protein